MLYSTVAKKVLYCVLYVALVTLFAVILDTIYLLASVQPISTTGLLITALSSWATLVLTKGIPWFVASYNKKARQKEILDA